MHKPLIRHFLHNLEFYLGGLSLLVILFLPRLLLGDDGNLLTASAMTAAIVAVLYGIILWGNHHRQQARRRQALRQEAIAQIKAMLQDLVRNKIALLLVDTYTATRNPEQREQSLERINQTIETVLEILDSISEDTLQEWQAKYGDIAKPRE